MSKYTASKRPLRLRYFETFSARNDALNREKQMKNYKQRAENIEARIQELAQYSDEQDCLSRIFGTKASMACRDKIAA